MDAIARIGRTVNSLSRFRSADLYRNAKRVASSLRGLGTRDIERLVREMPRMHGGRVLIRRIR